MALIASIDNDGVFIVGTKPFLSYRLKVIDNIKQAEVINEVITEPFDASDTESARAIRYKDQFQELINNYKNKELITTANTAIENSAAEILSILSL